MFLAALSIELAVRQQEAVRLAAYLLFMLCVWPLHWRFGGVLVLSSSYMADSVERW